MSKSFPKLPSYKYLGALPVEGLPGFYNTRESYNWQGRVISKKNNIYLPLLFSVPNLSQIYGDPPPVIENYLNNAFGLVDGLKIDFQTGKDNLLLRIPKTILYVGSYTADLDVIKDAIADLKDSLIEKKIFVAPPPYTRATGFMPWLPPDVSETVPLNESISIIPQADRDEHGNIVPYAPTTQLVDRSYRFNFDEKKWTGGEVLYINVRSVNNDVHDYVRIQHQFDGPYSDSGGYYYNVSYSLTEPQQVIINAVIDMQKRAKTIFSRSLFSIFAEPRSDNIGYQPIHVAPSTEAPVLQPFWDGQTDHREIITIENYGKTWEDTIRNLCQLSNGAMEYQMTNPRSEDFGTIPGLKDLVKEKIKQFFDIK
jgi:hypothetical protein